MKKAKRLTGRKCYDHLGGKLGAMLFEFLIANEWVCLDEGKSSVYVLTAKGENELRAMGFEI
jgi:predicted transcriptional regulator